MNFGEEWFWDVWIWGLMDERHLEHDLISQKISKIILRTGMAGNISLFAKKRMTPTYQTPI